MNIMGVLARCNDAIPRACPLMPQHARKHAAAFRLFADWCPVLEHSPGCVTGRRSSRPGRSEYLMTYLTAIKHQFLIRLSFSVICIFTTAMLLHSQHAVAAEWLTTPSLNLIETYSDNVGLAPPGSTKGDWVTQVNPGISAIGTGSRLTAHVSYLMQNILYAKETNQSYTAHLLNAGANAKLVDEFLFLDGSASISQQNISLFAPQTTDNINITNNRTNIATYSISPYLRHTFDAVASSELRFTRSEFRTGASGLSNTKADGTVFNLNSGPEFSRVGWGLLYNNQIVDYSNANGSVFTRTTSGNLRFVITPRFSLTATKGYEKFNYLSITGAPPEGHFWTGGFSWTPSQRTSVEASTGKRFFGNTHSLVASHQSRNTVWSLNYSEDITTTQAQFMVPATISTASFLETLWASSIPDPVLLQQTVNSFIQNYGLPASLSNSINYFTNQFFLQKQLLASVAINSSSTKSTFILSAFNTMREAQTAEASDSLLLGTNNLNIYNNTKQHGGSALWNWRFSPVTNVNASAAYTKSISVATDIETTTKMLRLGMTRQFRPKLNGSVDLRRTLQPANEIGAGYQENAIIASLLMQF